MKRLLVLGAVTIAVLLALRHPAPPAIVAADARRAAPSQQSRKGPSSPGGSGSSVVYVVGAVAHPGLYSVRSGARVDDAVRRAGGFLAAADPAAVNLAERVTDGEEIHVLAVGETPPTPVRRGKRKRASRTVSAAEAPIDLNAAGARALGTIPGIGATLAERIVRYRSVNGPFASIDELGDVAGITQSRIDAIAQYVTINSH